MDPLGTTLIMCVLTLVIIIITYYAYEYLYQYHSSQILNSFQAWKKRGYIHDNRCMSGCSDGICEDSGECMFNYQCQGCIDSQGKRVYPETRDDLIQYIDGNYNTNNVEEINELNREIAVENEYIRRRNRRIMRRV